MGRIVPPPEEAGSWDEFVARVEMQRAAQGATRPWWQATGALLFVTSLIWFAYGFQGGRPWMFGCGLASLAVVGLIAAHAVSAAEREGDHARQVDLMERTWRAHLEEREPRP